MGLTPSVNGGDSPSTQKQQQMKGQQGKLNGQQLASKTQATPSQKRANHEKLQKQRNQANVTAQKQANDDKTTTKRPRELDIKVSKLSYQNESCRQKIADNLSEFSKKAQAIKIDISKALKEQQTKFHDDGANLQADERVEKLRERIVELCEPAVGEAAAAGDSSVATLVQDQSAAGQTSGYEVEAQPAGGLFNLAQQCTPVATAQNPSADDNTSETKAKPKDEPNNNLEAQPNKQLGSKPPSKFPVNVVNKDTRTLDPLTASGCFEPLAARLDQKSRFFALKSSLDKHFVKAPELLEPICSKLVVLTRQIDQLNLENERQQQEIIKLRLLKEKLGDLCRELQKSNNQIRIESLSLIKLEQHKAKEQADKIQSTLAGVMNLFDENQQRNLALKQENVDLQTKLKALLEHCENWEQCVNTGIKQRDIENKLLKTELVRLNLVRAEEQERFVKEKQDLLRAIENMRTQQSRVEANEAKLRSDLTSYASKYDECQEIIQNGLGKFQAESKRMLKQIEKSRQDYVALLNKYETSNVKIKQLLEEKQHWITSNAQANKKLETLGRLCRSLKSENDRLRRGESAETIESIKSDSTESSNSTTSSTTTQIPLVINGQTPAQ